jgi:predicted amidohydrolase
MKVLRVGLAQVRQTANLDENVESVFSFLDKAAKAKVQILCFPETHVVGYRVDITPTDAAVEPDRLDEVNHMVAKRCGELGIACILGTETPLESDPIKGKPHNSAVVFSPQGHILAVHHKTRLTPLDAVAYTPGMTFEVVELFGVKVGVVICFEGFRFPETTKACVAQGAQVVFHPQSNTTRPNDWKIPVHHAMITTRAAENTIWFASSNMCHEHQNCRSMVIAPDGQVHAQSELRTEQLVVADIDTDLATQAMFKFDMEGCAKILFADTVSKQEYVAAGAMKV